MTTQRSRLAFVLILAALLCAVVGGLIWISNYIDRRVKDDRSGPLRVFPLRERPRFLTDQLALEKARDTLARDGYDLSVWQACEDGRSNAPDGTRDAFLSRNADDPNHGTILFHDRSQKDRNPTRIVQIEFKGERIECFVVFPK